MKTLFWLVFWFFLMPQANDFFVKHWDYITGDPAIAVGIFLFSLSISTTFCYFLFQEKFNTLGERLKAKDDDITRLEKLSKSKDEEIIKLKENNKILENKKLESKHQKYEENIINPTGKELAFLNTYKENSVETLNTIKAATILVEEIKSFVSSKLFGKHQYSIEEIDFVVKDGFRDTYLSKALTIKRELTAKINPDKTEISEEDYKNVNGVEAANAVGIDLLELIKKVMDKGWYK